MTNQTEITPKQIELLKLLNGYKNRAWESNTTQELIFISKTVLEHFSQEIPARIQFADGSSQADKKGKMLILKILENDIIELENKGYSNLKNEKFAIASTITLLMSVFVNVSIERMLDITKE